MAKAAKKGGGFGTILIVGIFVAAFIGSRSDESREPTDSPGQSVLHRAVNGPSAAPAPAAPPVDPDAWRADPWRAAALEEITANRFVRDAIFAARGSLWVGVADDGSRRDGLAETTCLDLAAAGMPDGESVVVRVVDYYAMLRQDMVTLGQAVCG